MVEAKSDSALVSDCLNGKREAWDTFVERFSKLVYYSINKTLRSHSCYLQEEDVADVYNSLFLAFLENDCKKLRQFEGKHGCSLSSWIRLITVRHTIDFLRGQRSHLSVDDEQGEASDILERYADGQASVQEQMELAEAHRELHQAIASLPESDQLFVKLYYEQELPPEDIAVILNVSVNTIYSKKNRLQEKLKTMI